MECLGNHIMQNNNRSVSKELIGDLTGVCADWKKAARLGSKKAAKYLAKP